MPFLRRVTAAFDHLPASRVVPLGLLAGLVLSTAFGASVARAVPSAMPADTMPVEDVKPGMKGYGLTVFSGTQPEKFAVEVISTLRNFRPNQDLILIKTNGHPRIDAARTVAGMSGSPVYLDGKMIGAYAYGWMFGSEAIAGVTPIKSMLDELARPVPRTIAPPPGGSPLPSASLGAPSKPAHHARAWSGRAEAYDLAAHAGQLATRSAAALAAPAGTPLARASTPLLVGGLGDGAFKVVSELLAPMGMDLVQAGGASGGKQDPNAPTKFVDGGAIGVELVRGDVSAMGLGTVTRVAGDRLLAFGHPMMNGGIESLPTAVGKVHWILATQNRSFKIGEAARSLGALVNDRQAAIVVDSTVKAPSFPVHVDVEGVTGAPHPSWNMEVAHDQFMAPTFTAMAIGSAVETTTSERRDMTWRATSRVKLAKYGTVTVRDFGAGNGNPLGADDFVRGRLVKAVGALLNNPWEPVTIERVDTKLEVTFARETFALRGTKLLDAEVDAGQPVRIRLDLQPYQGKLESRVIEVKVPAELAGREVEIELAPGYEVERPLPTPDSVADLVAQIPSQSFDPESVVATVRLRENGAAFRGKLASRLPPGAIDTLRPSSQSDAPETFVAQVQTPIPIGRFLVGRDAVRVFVRAPIK
jgi:hypothetical protein